MVYLLKQQEGVMETIEIRSTRNGQEISIPKELKIDDNKVYLKKVGNALYLIPFNNPWQNMQDSLANFTDDFMNERIQPEGQIREPFD